MRKREHLFIGLKSRSSTRAFTLIESMVALSILALWTVVAYAVVIKSRNPDPAVPAQPTELIIMETPLGNEPEASTRAATPESDANPSENPNAETR